MTEINLGPYQNLLERFSKMSVDAGLRSDYVQGGGGNTSAKGEGGLMFIKASGFCLKDVAPRAGYAVLDGAALKRFYEETDPKTLTDIEKEGTARAKELTLTAQGLPALRPSVEAGFHSLLDTFVLHTHSVYANLAACGPHPQQALEEALRGAPYAFALVPYMNPGAELTFAIRDILNQTRQETGERPAILLMQNHGLIAHAMDAEACAAIHRDANQRFMAYYGVREGDFPAPAIQQTGTGFVSDTPWLQARLKGQKHPDAALLDEALYPDQMVFFRGALGQDAVIDRASGVTAYTCAENAAKTIEETLCAVVFIRETLERRGQSPVPMRSAAQAFISNWESEAYRKAVGSGQGKQ